MMIVRELWQAWRRLAKRPGYTLLSISVLGVGLGVAILLFGAVNALIVQPHPFPHADRLMSVGEPHAWGVGRVDSDQYLALRGRLGSVETVGAYAYTRVNLGSGSGAQTYRASRMTASMLSMLGAKPLLGRGLVAADDVSGASPVVLLSEALWRHGFHANPRIVGHSVRVNGEWATVVGVLPTTFKFLSQVQMWLPMQLEPGQHRKVGVVARLAPSATLNQARAELGAWAGQLQRVLPPGKTARPLAIAPLSFTFTPRQLRHWAWMMLAAGLLVLLLACINVANLQLVQTLKRRHELALRNALGSGRGRLVLGTLVESLILSMIALAPAYVIAWGCSRWMHGAWLAVRPSSIPYAPGIDGWLVGISVLLALCTTALAGGIPAWRASRANLVDALHDGSKGSGGGFARAMKTLVVAEMALTVVLLVGAGSFVRALDHLLTQPTAGATHAAQILTAQVSLPDTHYHDEARRIQFYDAVVERLHQQPDVVDATATNTVPGAVPGTREHVSLPGHPEPSGGWPQVQMGIVGSHFSGTYGVRLLEGRFFDARDRVGSAPVAVIDTRMAASMWPNGRALNRKLVLHPGQPGARTVTVIGVIENMQRDGALAAPLPGLLVPLGQASGQSRLASVGLAVRVHADAAQFKQRLMATVHAVDPQAAVYNARTQARAISTSHAILAVLTDAFGFLGLMGLLLAAAGLYGVLAFSVTQRTREIGIRRAIGAGNAAVARTIGRTLAWQLGLGLVIGMVLAVPWSAMLANPAVGTRAHDPAVFATVIGLVVGVSVLAAVVPLVRALRVDPAEALRYE